MKKTSTILIIGTLVIIVGITFFLIKPTAQSILNSWTKLGQESDNQKNLDEKKQALESLSKNQVQITNVATIAENYIPTDNQSGKLVIELTAVAASNNIKVAQTSFDKQSAATPAPEETGTSTKTPAAGSTASTASTVQSLDFSLSLSGAYSDFINFLKTIETNSRLIIIKNIAITSGQTDAKLMTYNITGSSYYKSKISLENTVANIKVTDETIKKFLNLKTYGQPINLPAESGFGRPNPFEGY